MSNIHNDYLVDLCGDEGVFFDNPRKHLDEFYNLVFGKAANNSEFVLSRGRLFYCRQEYYTEDWTSIYNIWKKYLR